MRLDCEFEGVHYVEVLDRGDIRARFLRAAMRADGFDALLAVVRVRVAAGDSAETLYEDLESLRELLTEELEDNVLDVMDRVVGYCHPSVRLFPDVP